MLLGIARFVLAAFIAALVGTGLYGMMCVGLNVASWAGDLEGRTPLLGYGLMVAWLGLTFATVAVPLALAEKNGWLRLLVS